MKPMHHSHGLLYIYSWDLSSAAIIVNCLSTKIAEQTMPSDSTFSYGPSFKNQTSILAWKVQLRLCLHNGLLN